MPWEIDYALLTFTQLKKSKYYINSDVNIEIDSVLNLSSYIINWDDSKLPKEYFIDKYKNISKLLVDYKHNSKVFEENQIYGHLNLQKESKAKHVDYYINICPDMYFSEHLLSYLIQTIPYIKNKYFVVTPQISKLWDNTWDEITNSNYINIPYEKWNNVDVFDIRNNLSDILSLPLSTSEWEVVNFCPEIDNFDIKNDNELEALEQKLLFRKGVFQMLKFLDTFCMTLNLSYERLRRRQFLK